LGSRRIVVPPGQPALPFAGGAVGFLSYEAAGAFEPIPAARANPHPVPLAGFGLYDTAAVYDHAQQVVQLVTLFPLQADLPAAYSTARGRLEALRARLHGPIPAGTVADMEAGAPDGAAPEVRSNMTQAEFEALVAIAQEHILAGDIIQVVPSQRFER